MGTNQDNVKDRNNKNRQAKGSKQGQSQLKNEQGLEIQRLLAENNLTQRELCQLFGVASDTTFHQKR
jgi:predicted XRE-type DNA-binding protein